MLSGKGELPKLEDIYPELYTQEDILQKNTNEVADSFLKYALAFNQKTEKDGDDKWQMRN